MVGVLSPRIFAEHLRSPDIIAPSNPRRAAAISRPRATTRGDFLLTQPLCRRTQSESQVMGLQQPR